MRRDVDVLAERMDDIIRIAKAIRRTATQQAWPVPEEVYDNLHADTAFAASTLTTAWKTWASEIQLPTKKVS